jgi:hypothetical protein
MKHYKSRSLIRGHYEALQQPVPYQGTIMKHYKSRSLIHPLRCYKMETYRMEYDRLPLCNTTPYSGFGTSIAWFVCEQKPYLKCIRHPKRNATGTPRGHLVAATWPPRGRHVATTWPPRGRHAAATWPPRGANGTAQGHHVATSWPPRGRHVAPRVRHVATTWPPRGHHVAATSQVELPKVASGASHGRKWSFPRPPMVPEAPAGLL